MLSFRTALHKDHPWTIADLICLPHFLQALELFNAVDRWKVALSFLIFMRDYQQMISLDSLRQDIERSM